MIPSGVVAQASCPPPDGLAVASLWDQRGSRPLILPERLAGAILLGLAEAHPSRFVFLAWPCARLQGGRGLPFFMRITRFIASGLTILFVVVALCPLSADADFDADLAFPTLKGKVNVYFDERLVPHVFADNNEDLYFVQGYLHARFRLFQMELQTMYAAGRLCEIFGNNPAILKVDRETRRSGMVWAAQNALKEFEADPVSKTVCDAYTAGVNAYIESLTEAQLPIEYKLLGYKPEKWNNLKILN